MTNLGTVPTCIESTREVRHSQPKKLKDFSVPKTTFMNCAKSDGSTSTEEMNFCPEKKYREMNLIDLEKAGFIGNFERSDLESLREVPWIPEVGWSTYIAKEPIVFLPQLTSERRILSLCVPKNM